MWRALAVLATSVLIACPGPGRARPASRDDRSVRIRIAQAEAKRGGGVAELADLANRGDRATRLLAIRGLGRIGSARGLELLRDLLADRDEAVVGAAAAAIGLAALLDDPTIDATRPLIDALGRLSELAEPAEASSVLVIEALGRAGDLTAIPALVGRLDGASRIAESAALALGRFGRRKLALTPAARSALAAHTASPDGRARAAVLYALSREHLAPGQRGDTDDLARRLAARLADDDPEIRATAVAALSRRKLVADARTEIQIALLDRDARVAVEAVRALATELGGEAGLKAIAQLLQAGSEIDPQVALEALRGLRSSPLSQRGPTSVMPRPKLRVGSAVATAWVDCLTRQPCSLPDHLRLPLAVDEIKDGSAPIASRRALLGMLLSHRDARVNAAGLGALAVMWKHGEPSDRRTAMLALVAALGSRDPIIAGSAIEAAAEVYELIGGDDHAALDAAVVERARTERDPELAGAVLELIGKRAIAGGAEACRATVADHPVRARAARQCRIALGQSAEPVQVAAATPPPIDVTSVIGRRIKWHVVTTRGEIVIALAPDVAPWAVATIVALTRKGFYDGIEFHRVVPNFVVQGGDPTMSGWGGPGFTLPSEPSSSADGPGFVRGGVGIADAGRDSGGSQWFIMHSRAAHLDGRYTWIGSVASGQTIADALVIGDKIVRATIEMF